jgi:hypothetical protein
LPIDTSEKSSEIEQAKFMLIIFELNQCTTCPDFDFFWKQFSMGISTYFFKNGYLRDPVDWRIPSRANTKTRRARIFTILEDAGDEVYISGPGSLIQMHNILKRDSI